MEYSLFQMQVVYKYLSSSELHVGNYYWLQLTHREMRFREVKQLANDNKWRYLIPHIFILSIMLVFMILLITGIHMIGKLCHDHCQFFMWIIFFNTHNNTLRCIPFVPFFKDEYYILWLNNSQCLTFPLIWDFKNPRTYHNTYHTGNA